MGEQAEEINQLLLEQGVIVRPIAGYGMPRHLRVSIGLPEENDRFIESLARALDALSAAAPGKECKVSDVSHCSSV